MPAGDLPGVGQMSSGDFIMPQPGAMRRYPNGLIVQCHTRCIIHFRDDDGEPMFTHRPEDGSNAPYAVIKSCEPAAEDGRPTGHNGLHEIPNYDTLPRDLRPKPKLNAAGKKMLILDPTAKDPQNSARVFAHELYVDPETGVLITETEDWGSIFFTVCNPVTLQPDRELHAKYEADYRKRHGLKQPMERKKMLEVVIQDYPDDRQPPESLANQLLMDRLKASESRVEELTNLVEKLLKSQAEGKTEAA